MQKEQIVTLTFTVRLKLDGKLTNERLITYFTDHLELTIADLQSIQVVERRIADRE